MFKSIKDFNLEAENDNLNYFKILNSNISTGRKLSKLFLENKDFYISPIGEIFTELPEHLKNNEEIKYFFNVTNNKIGSRGIGYYGLFGDAYKIENRENYYKNNNLMNTFWNEYDRYINILEKLLDQKETYLIYLDNYRNLLLVWINIFIFILKSNKKKHKIIPLNNLSFQDIRNEVEIKNIKKKLIRKYNDLLENILKLSINNENINKEDISDIKNIYNDIKEIINKDKVIKTKKNTFSIINYFNSDENIRKAWFEKIFRNIREEDNLGVIIHTLLQKNIISKEDIDCIGEIIKKEKNEKHKRKEDTIFLSILYGGIEFSLVLRYLGYKTGWINYSVYNLKKKDTYIDENDIIEPINFYLKGLKSKKIYILDDQISSGKTIEKVKSILSNNNIPVINNIVARIYLNKKQLKIVNNYKKIIKISKFIKSIKDKREITRNKNGNRSSIQIKIGKGVLEKISKYIVTDSINKEDVENYIRIKYIKDPEINEIFKNTAINSLYINPRKERKNRNINILMSRKILSFKKFGKEFRSI